MDTPHQVFAGEFRHIMDPKHRLTFPARWRHASCEEFSLMPSQQNDHVLGPTVSGFEKVSRVVEEHDAISPRDQRAFLRRFYSKAQLCALDRQGRLLLPNDLRGIAGIESALVLVGAYNRFEVWNPERWSKMSETEQQVFSHVANLIGL